MKISIRDPETLELVKPGDAEAYLAAHEWHRVNLRPGECSIWERSDVEGRMRKATVLLDRDFADYAERTHELLDVVSETEGRSQLAVFDDVFRIRLDSIAVRSEHPGATDGSIPVYEGANLVENAVEMVEAAACSTVDPKPRYMARRPKQANEYTDHLRMGQTSRGSYVVNLYSPLQIPSDPPADQLTLEMQGVAPPVEGFGRRTVRTLVRALVATKIAASKAVIDGSTSMFIDTVMDTVKQGVSSNLLGAVAGMMGDESPRVEVSVRWSPFVKLPAVLPTSVTFERRELVTIERAAEQLRQQAPDENVMILGHVVQLNRTSVMFGDRIYIDTILNDRKSRVLVTLWDEDYKKALIAIRDFKQLQCRGRLVKFGRSYRLEDPQDVTIIN